MKYIFYLCGLVVMSLIFLHPAMAQDNGVWKAQCLEDKMTCQMSQQLIAQETGQRVLEFVIVHDKQKKTTRGVTIMPLGVYLPAGVILKVDDHKPYKFSYNHCAKAGCTCFHDMPQTLISQMKKGRFVSFIGTRLDGQQVSFNLSLKDFTKTYQALLAN